MCYEGSDFLQKIHKVQNWLVFVSHSQFLILLVHPCGDTYRQLTVAYRCAKPFVEK